MLVGSSFALPALHVKPRFARSTGSGAPSVVPLSTVAAATSVTDLETAASYGNYAYNYNYMYPMKYSSMYPSTLGYGKFSTFQIIVRNNF